MPLANRLGCQPMNLKALWRSQESGARRKPPGVL
jgi:hypothetical protein